MTSPFARWSGERDARSRPPPCAAEVLAAGAALRPGVGRAQCSERLARGPHPGLSLVPWARGERYQSPVGFVARKPTETSETGPDYTDAMLHPYCKRMTGPTNSLLQTGRPCCKRFGLVANGCLRPPPGDLPSDRSSTSLGRKGSPAARCPSPGHTPCCKSPHSRRSGCCWVCSGVRMTPILVASVLQTRPALRFQLPGDCYQVGVLPGLLGGPFKILNL